MGHSYSHLKKARVHALALRPLRNLVMSMIALVACGFFVLVNVFSYWGGEASESWPSVQGRVVKSEVCETTGKSGRNYQAQVVYAYEVDGKAFEGDSISFGGATSNKKSEMDLLVNDFAIGKTVPVYYNPKDPKEACLVKGVQDSSMLVMGAFGVGLMMSLRKMVSSGRELRGMLAAFSQG